MPKVSAYGLVVFGVFSGMGSQEAFLLGDQWRCMMRLLPDDLEQSASQTGALSRKRQVRDAQTLLRLILAYCYLDLSLRDVSAWAQQTGVAQVSDVAILKRLRGAADWVAHLVGQELAERGLGCVDQGAPAAEGRRLRVVDASTVVAPGSSPTTKGHDGHDWRVHLSLSLRPLRVDEVHLTDWTGGESLTRFELGKDDICLCDRGYAHRAAFAAVVAAGADVIVRLPWKNLPLLDVAEKEDTAGQPGQPGQPFDILGRVDERLRPATAGTVCEFDVQTAPDPKNGVPAVYGRLVAVNKSAEAAERAGREARAKARTYGRTLDERTLAACGYVFVFTTLPAHDFDNHFDAAQILALYRLRWQVKLCFKRLKGILGLEELRAKDPQLARTYLMGKLLMALFADGLAHRWLGFPPGIVVTITDHSNQAQTLQKPGEISFWRLFDAINRSLRSAVGGYVPLAWWLQPPESFPKGLADRPRQRQGQTAHIIAASLQSGRIALC